MELGFQEWLKSRTERAVTNVEKLQHKQVNIYYLTV